MEKNFLTILALLGLFCAVQAANAADDGACPFRPAELKAAFGVAFEAGKADWSDSFAGLTMTSCRYKSPDYSLVVNRTVYPSEAEAKKHFSYPMYAGSMKLVPNDPDGARFQVGQGDLTDPSLHYVRGKSAVGLRIMGIYYSGPKETDADLSAMQQKLLKLRRVQ